MPEPMNPWHVTTDPKSLRRLGKTIEEMGELIAVLGRVIIQGIDEVDPSSGDTNRLRLQKESADVSAQLRLNMDAFDQDLDMMFTRSREKERQMGEWEAFFNTPQGGDDGNAAEETTRRTTEEVPATTPGA